jgi:hypothetical protein
MGSKYHIGQKELENNIESAFPKKKLHVPFGNGGDRFKKFFPVNIMPGPGAYDKINKNGLVDPIHGLGIKEKGDGHKSSFNS